MKKFLWVLVSCLMTLSLVIASCGSDTTDSGDNASSEGKTIVTSTGQEETIEVTTDAPEYGGTVSIVLNAEPSFDLLGWFASAPQHLAHQSLWDGDWTRGPAGGYGTGEVLWEESTNVPEYNTGYIAESWSWVVNDEDQTVITTIKIRDNIYFQDTGTAAGEISKGRKMTVEDVAWCMDQHLNNENSQNYYGFPECQGIRPEVTGENEITIVHPFSLHLGSIMRLFSYVLVFPPELYDEYGYESCTDITLSVGTGPFYVDNYIPSNVVSLARNDNYWMTDPIGPGEGNQLPYADAVKFIIMPDKSTRHAALRSAQVDQLDQLEREEYEMIINSAPKIMSATRGQGYTPPVYFRLENEPWSNKDVRRALMMAIDLDEINEALYNGEGDLVGWPYYYTPAYEALYLGLDDPEMPESVKELFTYNPEKSKQMLADAGFPSGFKAEITLIQDWVDYYSIVKNYWEQVGVDLELKIIDTGALVSVAMTREWNDMMACYVSPCSTYPEQGQYTGDSWLNTSQIHDPYVDEMADRAREAGVTSLTAAMDITKEMQKYLLDQVYAIPAPHYSYYTMWWPWIRNYTGEVSVGYMCGDTWTQWVWVDQDMKQAMGY